MNKRILASPFLILIALILTACNPAATPAAELLVTDGLGRTVSLDGPAQRIISLAPSNTEILFALGAGDQLVARDDFSDFPPEALELGSIGDTYSGVNSESIVSLESDLVLAAEITPVEYVEELENLGVTVFWLANPVDLEGLYQNLATIAELAGREEEALALTEQLKIRVSAVEDTLAAAEKQPTVFYEIDATDPSAPWTAGKGTFIDQLIMQAGGVNIARVLDGAYAQLSIEELLLQDPQIILLGDAAFGATAESVAERAGWDSLFAVQNQQVYPFDDNLASRPGPRLIDALEELARLLHPDLFN